MGEYGVFTGRIEDDRLITGAGQYVDDVRKPGMVHAVMVRSPYAHARITSIDASAAEAAPGVVAVLTRQQLAEDGIGDLLCGVELKRPNGETAHQARRPPLARDRVRFVGEVVAMVIAEQRIQADDAVELVSVDYEELPAVAGTEAALKPGAVTVWDEVPDNIAFCWQLGDTDAADTAIAAASHVVKLSSHVTRVHANTLEPRGSLAYIGDDGRLTVHIANQSPHGFRNGLATLIDMPADQVRVIAGDVGGSFGMKSGAYAEDLLVAWAARRFKRPVSWTASRSEGFLSDDHARDVRFDAELALNNEGLIQALKVHFDIGIGCYLSRRSMGLIGNIGGIAGVYRMPHIVAEIHGVFTHTQTTAPYRGAGRPEATYAIERMMDLAAVELGIDPFDLRRRNLVPSSAMPYDTGFRFTYDCGEFEGNMTRAAEISDRNGFAERRREAASRGMLLGMGFANPIEAAGGPYVAPAKDFARVDVEADGAIQLYVGSMSVGQGLETMFSELLADRLGVAVETIEHHQGDTDDLPGGRGNGGSSATPVGASVVALTADALIATGAKFAAEMLQAAQDDIAYSDGAYALAGSDRSVSLQDVARHAAEQSEDGLTASAEFQPPAVTFPNGCHICEIEIDPETGTSEIKRYTVVEDLGNVLNPTLVRGQMHGGVAMGIGQALGEVMIHDEESAQLQTASFMDYMMPRADDMPVLQIETREIPTTVNPMGAKGVGEAGTVGSLVATINAVCDALGPVGVTHIEMPASPARVWAAIEQAKAAG